MPVIIVELWEGRSADQKKRLVKAFTQAMVDIAGSSPEHLHVIFHDVPKESWGRNGVLAPDLVKEKK
jgi:4-oxalocrotonate tautomerase